MSFLPDWWSKGVQGQDSNGGFGTANMFKMPRPDQQGNLGGAGDKIAKLIDALRKPRQEGMPDSNAMPQMTPYQQQPMGPDMGQVNYGGYEAPPGNPYAPPQSGQNLQMPTMQGQPIGPNMGQINKQPKQIGPAGNVGTNWANVYGGN